MYDSVRPQRRQPTRLSRPWDSPGKNTGMGRHFLLHCMKVKRESEVAQSCLTLCDPMDCSLPGSTIHGIFQARVLEWAAISFSRGSSQHRDQIHVSCTADSLVQFSRSLVFNSLRPQEPQHTRPPCPLPIARVYPNSYPLSW